MQRSLNKALWQACTTSRGAIEASDYKNYLLTMLFLKYLTDVKGEETSTFTLPDHCSFTYLYEQRDEPEIGAMINRALADLEAANGERLKGVFKNIDFDNEARLGGSNERQRLMKGFLEGFQPLDLSPQNVGDLDVIGNAYEYLLGRFAAGAGRQAGEYYTPPGIAELMVGLAEPQPGETICDPTCGSGSLLIRCGNHIKKGGSANFQLFGQEITPTTWALAKMNMVLHGLERSLIQMGDTIRNPRLLDEDGNLMKFHVVVANPPFSRDRWGKEEAKEDPHDRFKWGLPSSSRGDFGFISHMVTTMMAETGRVIVVVSNGLLFRRGVERDIRKALIEEGLVDAVVRLPANLFFGTTISASILVFRSKKVDDQILFIDASKMFRSGKKQHTLSETTIQRIIEIYRTRQAEEGVSFLADIPMIEAMDFDLKVDEYVQPFKVEDVLDPGETFKVVQAAAATYGKTMDEMEGIIREMGYEI